MDEKTGRREEMHVYLNLGFRYSYFPFQCSAPALGILNPSTGGTIRVSEQMALFFISFPGQGVRNIRNAQ